MIKKNFFTSILSLCEKHNIESRSYHTGDIVLDNESNHNLYIFSSGLYTVWSQGGFGGMHQVGEIVSPSIIGEGVFFGSFKKPVRIVTEKAGIVYILTEKTIASIARDNPAFYEILMRTCLVVANERIHEANTERTLGYALVDALETQSFGNIHKLLTILKETFFLKDVIWIERHEILHDIFFLRYRESHGNTPINERIILPEGESSEPYIIPDFFSEGNAHIYPLVSGKDCFGYLVYISPNERLSGYISRITLDMIPNCIRIIESGWKKQKISAEHAPIS